MAPSGGASGRSTSSATQGAANARRQRQRSTTSYRSTKAAPAHGLISGRFAGPATPAAPVIGRSAGMAISPDAMKQVSRWTKIIHGGNHDPYHLSHSRPVLAVQSPEPWPDRMGEAASSGSGSQATGQGAATHGAPAVTRTPNPSPAGAVKPLPSPPPPPKSEICYASKAGACPLVWRLIVEGVDSLFKQGFLDGRGGFPVNWDSEVFYALTENNDVIGVICFTYQQWTGQYYISFGYVKSDERRSGVYRALFNRLVEHAKKNQISQIVGTVCVRNEVMIAAIQKLGRRHEMSTYVYDV